MSLSAPARGHAAMFAFAGLVAGSFSLGALSTPHVDPAAFTALRFWIAAAVLGAAVAATRPALAPARTAPWRWLVLGGLLSLYFVLMFEGLRSAPPVSAAAVFTLTPAMAALFGWWLLRQRTTPRMGLALALGAAGALWVIFRADLRALLAFDLGRGEAVYLAGCAAHALYTPMVRRLNRGEGAVLSSCLTLVAGAGIVTAWAWPAIRATDWAGLPAIVWICLAYVTLAATAASFVLVQYATLRLPAAKVMAYTYLTPAWVILWEVGLTGRLPPALVAVGVAMTGAALLILLREEGLPAPAPGAISPRPGGPAP
jgi:drug/metabolite transporter (DMT)-like permease